MRTFRENALKGIPSEKHNLSTIKWNKKIIYQPQ